jgi:hypothetical protein
MILVRTVDPRHRAKIMAKAHLKLVTPAAVKRTVTPKRLANAKLRTRENLTETEVERLMAAAKDNRYGHRESWPGAGARLISGTPSRHSSGERSRGDCHVALSALVGDLLVFGTLKLCRSACRRRTADNLRLVLGSLRISSCRSTT